MILVSWNVRGAGKVECASTIRDLKKAYGIDVFVVLELRIGGSRALSVAKSLGFSHYHIVDPIGFSGGVWLLWNDNSISLHVVAHSSQTITALVTMDAKRWLLIVVYASPCSNVRTSLWKYFDGLTTVCNLPWLLLGDFNDIVCGDEKLGGNLDVGGQHFIEWLDRNHLIDLGFSGANFTWCNKRGEEDIIWKRLDRGLCNIDWRFLFSEAHLSHLPRVNSDHCPIMVKLFSNHLPAKKSMPFRFQAMWLSHPSFFEFLSGLWNSGTGNAFQKPASLIWPLQHWNKQVFGCLFQKKRRILAWLAGIQRSLCMQFNPFLSQLETDLTTEHNRILDQEEGCLDEPTLSGEYSLLPQYFPKLEHSDCTRLNGEVSNVEIQSSLFAIGGLKMSGPDGASLPEHLNDTLIALVPKVERPLNMAQLRPISLWRHIVDNIVIAQEMLHKFKVAKGQKGFIAWKIDLSKPYDHLSWSFIRGVLCEIGIGGRILELIMHCISSVHYKAILNGELIADFSPKYGIRQGDPLSPYIFGLCMEKLSHIIQQKVLDQSWKTVQICQGGPFISHLFFADDLVLFGKASIEQALVMKQCLDDFCSLSGQKVSFEKSMVCVSPNTCPGLAQNIASISGSPLSNKLKFSLGHAFDEFKVHLVNWETVCKSKCAGGLGVKAAWMNQALLAKSGWRLLHNDQGLWAKVLKAKYLKNCDMLSVNEHKFRNCSSSWRGVLFGAKLLPSDVKWRVGSGDSILFWTDVWLSCGALINYALIDLSEEMLQLNVSDFLEEGLWDIACLQECLPPDIVFMITSIHAGFIDSGPDMCIWRFTSNGKFYVKYADQLFCSVEAGSNWHWGFIWRLQLPPKVKTFLWVLCHKKLLTNAQRHRKGMAVSTSCPRCIYPVESVEHLFKGCSSSFLIWNQFGSWFEESSGLYPNFDDWLFHNLHSKRSFMTGLAWNLVFAVILWFIWKWRCKFIFEHGFLLPSEPHKVILQYVKDWLTATKSISIPLHQGVVYLHWQAPLPGRCKVNSDGSRKHALGYIGARGLLRDHAGNWIKGFYVNLGVGSVIEVELWGIFWELHLAWEAGFRSVEVECDSKSVVAATGLGGPWATSPRERDKDRRKREREEKRSPGGTIEAEKTCVVEPDRGKWVVKSAFGIAKHGGLGS
ncbi:unnamed protein product [Prunus armeniaca]